ncbi:MAG: serine hydrolase [Myxococcales bacterium]|nr:serine hydrolase [Myxococcales bacterium]
MNATLRFSSALLVAITVAACGGGGKAPATPAPPPTAPAPTPPTQDPPAQVEGPTAEESLTWVLATIASGQVTAADVEARFAPAFLKQVPAAQLVTIFTALHDQLPPVKILKQEGQAPRTLSALLDTGSGGVRVDVAMSATRPRMIEGLLFKPASAEAPPKTYGDAVAMLEKAGGKSQLFVGQLVKGACVPKQNHNTTMSLAVGSTFKLYVLLGLDEKIRGDKKLSWDTKLAVRDAGKSLPSGTMQDEAAGTEHTLREFATQMISISDNTATDHLIDFVGDAGVEKALKLAKHGTPAANIPFLRTRELFGLKLTATPEELAAYRKANVAGKRKLAAELRARPIDVATAIKDWGDTPRALDLEWFGDARDLCNVMATLGTRAKLSPDAELLKILSKNAGVEIDRSQWNYVGFKGGSEPGVMNLTWLLQRADGLWFVVVVAVNDDGHALDEGLIVNAATGTLAILGAEVALPTP